VLCHARAIIGVDECGAVEFFSHGARLVGIEGRDGKLAPDAVGDALAPSRKAMCITPAPALILANATSSDVYRPGEIGGAFACAARWPQAAHGQGTLRQCGCRAECTPAELIWMAGSKLGVPALSHKTGGWRRAVTSSIRATCAISHTAEEVGSGVEDAFVSPASRQRWRTTLAHWRGATPGLPRGARSRRRGGGPDRPALETKAVFVALTTRSRPLLPAAVARSTIGDRRRAGISLVRLGTSFATLERRGEVRRDRRRLG